ncbi:PD-(D/E)XK nuclease family protein, partial [Stenotrophomonas sp. A3_2]|uniref:PD-(D/E)XK nuclease family protein n=1 Tax=Stenotrophomonas sp. A3_2 TaxID=3119978 RepID=UPI002FC2A5E7
PALAAWWRPRLARIAAWVAEEEMARRIRLPNPRLIAAEQAGAWTFAAPAGPFTLTGRADRIDMLADGTLALLDYKTGTVPPKAAVERGHAAQLTLEAAMAAEGGFGAALRGAATQLTYWKLSGGRKRGEARNAVTPGAESVAAGQEAGR